MMWPDVWAERSTSINMPAHLNCSFSLHLQIALIENVKILIIALLFALPSVDQVSGSSDWPEGSLQAAEALRSIGFQAKEFYFKTRDGYVLNIVRARNPLISYARNTTKQPRREPLLFVHGTGCSSTIWLVNSLRGVRPRDLAKEFLASSKRSWHELKRALRWEPSARSLPLLALNLGHEVWLLNRRGAPRSDSRAGHLNRTLGQALASVPYASLVSMPEKFAQVVGQLFGLNRLDLAESLLPKLGAEFINQALADALRHHRREVVHNFDPDYWKYTMDEQALIDLPQAIVFVLSKSQSKTLALVAHSSGGAIALLALCDRAKFMNEKVSTVVLWSPALNINSPIAVRLSTLKPIIEPHYIGPLIPVFLLNPLRKLLGQLCGKNELVQKALCKLLLETLLGETDEFSSQSEQLFLDAPQPNSDLELGQLIQNIGQNKVFKYKYVLAEDNLKRYSNLTPPQYDLSLISHPGISLFVGNSDALVLPSDVLSVSSQLTVPHSMQLIEGPRIKFNHAAYFVHDLAAELVVIPSMLRILQADRSSSTI